MSNKSKFALDEDDFAEPVPLAVKEQLDLPVEDNDEVELKASMEENDDPIVTRKRQQTHGGFTRTQLFKIGCAVFLTLMCIKTILFLFVGAGAGYIYYVASESAKCFEMAHGDSFGGIIELSKISTVKLNQVCENNVLLFY